MTEGQDLEVNGRIGQNTWQRDKTGLVLAWHLPSEKTSVSHNKGNSKCDVTVMENWADHTAWVSSTDKKGDKKQQMGHVFPKTMLQDTGLLCSNEMVVPSCHALARTLAIPWIKERHAQRLEKQQANRCRQIHVQKSTEKQSHSTPPPPTRTHPDEHPGTPPPNHSGSGVGRKRRGGRKLLLGSWHSTWPTASSAVPASQTLPSWWAPRAGVCSIAAPLAPFCLRSVHLQSREAATAAQLIPVLRRQKSSWGYL